MLGVARCWREILRRRKSIGFWALSALLGLLLNASCAGEATAPLAADDVEASTEVGGDVARDIARVRDVEDIRREGEIVLYDVNRGWTRQQALRVMSATQDLNVMFEQPCETLDDIVVGTPSTLNLPNISKRVY